MKVTAKMLRAVSACENGVRVFEEEWPKGTGITKKACLRAAELGLDVEWFASEFLSKKAREVYNKAIAPAWEAYYKVVAPAQEAYYKAVASAWEAYYKATAIALYEAYRDHK